MENGECMWKSPSDFFDDDGVNERDDAACHV